MDILPAYLREFSYNRIQKSDSLVFNIKCTCGNQKLKILKGKTNESKKAELIWDNYWKKYRFVPIFSFGDATERKSGKKYTYGNTFFGIRVGKLYNEEISYAKDLCVVKAVCPNCSKEIILFDNRKHGYDALSDMLDKQSFDKENIPFANENSLIFHNQNRGNECAITIAIRNNLSSDDFYETFGSNASDEDYSIAFSWIKIISIVGSKKHIILDEETS